MTFAITDRDQLEATVRVDIKTEDLVLLGFSGVAGVEEATVSVDDGIGSTPQVVQEEVSLALTVDNNVTHLRGPGRYIINKPSTGADAHLFLYVPAYAEVEIEEV